MPLSFCFDAPSPRVVFGPGALDRLPDELHRLGAGRVLVLCTPGRGPTVSRVAALLGERLAGVFDRAAMHVPVAVAEAARSEAERLAVDCCVSVGGGSATGLAKAVTLLGGPPSVAVPTTYAGSEMTSIWGTSDGERKTTGRDPRVTPRTVLYDPELTLSLPGPIAGPSGLNALAHCVEALYAPDANPVTSLLAEEAIRLLARSLPAVVSRPLELEPRGEALYGAMLAGAALGAVTMGLHHRLCHLLGGSFSLPHAETHAVLLPYVVGYNSAAAPEAVSRVARAMGVDDAAAALHDLGRAVGAPSSLAALGMRESDLDRAAELAVEAMYPNPRPVTRDGVRALLADALRGSRPQAGSPARNSNASEEVA